LLTNPRYSHAKLKYTIINQYLLTSWHGENTLTSVSTWTPYKTNEQLHYKIQTQHHISTKIHQVKQNQPTKGMIIQDCLMFQKSYYDSDESKAMLPYKMDLFATNCMVK